MQKQTLKTLDGGSLGSSVDEERGQPRELMRIAGLSEHRHLERTLRPRDTLSRGPVRSRGGKLHVLSLDSRETSHRPPRICLFSRGGNRDVAGRRRHPRSKYKKGDQLLILRLPFTDRGVASVTTASSQRRQEDDGRARSDEVVFALGGLKALGVSTLRRRRHRARSLASFSRSYNNHSKNRRPRLGRDDPLNLSISLSGGKETNRDSLSNGE